MTTKCASAGEENPQRDRERPVETQLALRAVGPLETAAFQNRLDQARDLLTHVKGHRLEALITVALSTGLRQGELLGLGWDDVDLDAGTIRVRHALQRVGGRLVLVEPKSVTSHLSASQYHKLLETAYSQTSPCFFVIRDGCLCMILDAPIRQSHAMGFLQRSQLV